MCLRAKAGSRSGGFRREPSEAGKKKAGKNGIRVCAIRTLRRE